MTDAVALTEEAAAYTGELLSRILTLRASRESITARDGRTFRPYTMSSSLFDPVALYESSHAYGTWADATAADKEEGKEGEGQRRLETTPLRIPGAFPGTVDGKDLASVFVIVDDPAVLKPGIEAHGGTYEGVLYRMGVGFTPDGSVRVWSQREEEPLRLGERLAHVLRVHVPPSTTAHALVGAGLHFWRASVLAAPSE